jgi:hypothetical protein
MNPSDIAKKIRIPIEIIEKLENEINGICHGSVQLEITLRDKNIVRFLIKKETSLLASDLVTGGTK